jgi:hypothetical protein
MLRESGADAPAQRNIHKRFSKNMNCGQLDQLVHPAVLMSKEAVGCVITGDHMVVPSPCRPVGVELATLSGLLFGHWCPARIFASTVSMTLAVSTLLTMCRFSQT